MLTGILYFVYQPQNIHAGHSDRLNGLKNFQACYDEIIFLVNLHNMKCRYE